MMKKEGNGNIIGKHKKVNIVHYVTGQYMRLNKKRTFTTFIGILFMVLLMTCVFVGKDTAIDYLQNLASMKEGKWHAVLYDVGQEQLGKVQEMEAVTGTAASMDMGMTVFEQSGNAERPYLNIKAYETRGFDWYNIDLIKGRLPEKVDEIIVSAACLDDGAGLKIGDTIDAAFFERTITGRQKNGIEFSEFPFFGVEIKNGETITPPQNFLYLGNIEDFQENREYTGQEKRYTVVGLMEVPFYEEKDAAAYTGLTLLDEETLKAADKFNLSIQFDLDTNFTSTAYGLSEIGEKYNLEYNDYMLIFSGDSGNSTFDMLVNLMTVFFVALIMFASMILIYNVFNMSFQERCQYLGMISSVGATARQKRSSIYYEAFRLLAPAIPAGILLGMGIVKAGMYLLRPFIMRFMYLFHLTDTLPVTLSVSWRALALVAIISIVTVFVSAFLPARKIGKIGAVESIRGNGDRKNKIYKMKENGLKWFGAEGLLAGSVLKRQGRKKKSISRAVIIYMVILLVTAFGSEAIHMVAENKRDTDDAVRILKDNQGILGFSPGEEMGIDLSKDEYRERRKGYEALKEELAGDSGVIRMEEWYETMFAGYVDAGACSQEYWDSFYDIVRQYYNGEYSMSQFEQEDKREAVPVDIMAVDNDTLADIAKKTGSDYESLVNPDKMAAIIINEAVLSTDKIGIMEKKPSRYRYHDIQHITDMQTGDHFDMNIYSEKEEEFKQLDVEVAGLASNEQLAEYVKVKSEYMWLIVSVDTVKKMAEIHGDYDPGQVFSEFVTITVDKGHMEILDRLMDFEMVEGDIYFYGKEFAEMTQTMTDALVKIVDIMLVCFVCLTSVICLMNMGNSIGGRIADRRKEFAVMQSIGMTRRQMEKMLMLECCGILAEGMVIAIVIALALMLLIRQKIISLFGYVALKLPVLLMLLSVVFTVAAVLMITLYSFRKEKEQNLIENIRNESV